jgi:hypothetical protein
MKIQQFSRDLVGLVHGGSFVTILESKATGWNTHGSIVVLSML